MKNKEIRNPFIISGYNGPEYFCDRESETCNIINALENDRNISLISPRRMGKTGLIQHVFHTITTQNKDIKCYYIDIFATQNLQDLVVILGKTILGTLDSYSESARKKISQFFSHLRPSFSFDPITNVPTVDITIQETKTEVGLQEIFNYLKASDTRCYIGIDEFQQITEYPEKGVEALLRSYIQFLPNVKFIFAGSKKHLMDAMFSSANRPFYQSTQKIGLKEIPLSSYSEFAIKLFEENDRHLSKDVFEYVYEKMMGHTWYIQYILNLLFSESKNEYVISDVNDVIFNTLEEENATYKTYCEVIAKGQLRLLQAIAKENKVSKPLDSKFMHRYNLTAASSVRQALEGLMDKTLILKDDDGYYSVYDRFFSLWLEMNYMS